MNWDEKAGEYINDVDCIKGFVEENRWLSNFYPCVVVYEDKTYKNSEAAYQAAKTLNLEERIPFETMGAGTSKRKGQLVTIRPDWDEVKLNVMYDIIKDKFCRNLELTVKLLETGDKYLEETNWWNDTFWGVCKGVGTNHLGKILMKVREELKDPSSCAS